LYAGNGGAQERVESRWDGKSRRHLARQMQFRDFHICAKKCGEKMCPWGSAESDTGHQIKLHRRYAFVIIYTIQFRDKKCKKISPRFSCVQERKCWSLSLYLTEHYVMKTCGGRGCIDRRFLDLGNSWRRVVSFTPLPLYSRGKSSRYPLDRRLSGPRAGMDDVEKRKFLTLPGHELRPLGRPACSQSLYWLLYIYIYIIKIQIFLN
jgi:hypothetical protein